MISKLREDLLVNRNYDRMAKPVVNASKTVIVDIKFVDVHSYDLDILTGALSTNLGMFMSWTDEHLTWNKSAYQGLDEIIMDTKDVWMPTLQGMARKCFSTVQFELCSNQVSPNRRIATNY